MIGEGKTRREDEAADYEAGNEKKRRTGKPVVGKTQLGLREKNRGGPAEQRGVREATTRHSHDDAATLLLRAVFLVR